MRRRDLFWGSALVLLGALFLLGNTLGMNIWSLVWPLFLILLGLWVVWGVASGGEAVEAEEATIPLEGAGRARVRIKHGAGRLSIDAGAGPGDLVAGTFGGGLERRVKRQDDALDVKMQLPSRNWSRFAMPWNWGSPGALNWEVGLSKEIPLSLDLETGASDTRLDLTELLVTDLHVQTGASSTLLTLPANAGHTRARIESGVASVKIRVPAGVAARIRATGGLSEVAVDTSRFPRADRVYQSADYDAAPNKVEIGIEMGMGSVDVR